MKNAFARRELPRLLQKKVEKALPSVKSMAQRTVRNAMMAIIYLRMRGQDFKNVWPTNAHAPMVWRLLPMALMGPSVLPRGSTTAPIAQLGTISTNPLVLEIKPARPTFALVLTEWPPSPLETLGHCARRITPKIVPAATMVTRSVDPLTKVCKVVMR
jgi:hypothetical protein